MATLPHYFWPLRWILLVCLSFALSCTRSLNPLPEGWSDRFPQGTADNLIPIDFLRLPSYAKSLDDDNPYGFEGLKASMANCDSSLKIKTVSKGEKVKVSAGEKGAGIDPDVSFRNAYEIVDYNAVKPKTGLQKRLKDLLGKVEFHGFSDTEYCIVPHFDRNYLVFYKVGRWEDLPYDERHLGVKNGDMVAVPFVGYPIKYCKGEVLLDNNDQETGLSRPVCKNISIKEARYIELDKGIKQRFSYLPKLDLFPKDFFNGKWFYFITIVQSPEHIVEGHNPFQAARLVEFNQQSDKLEVRDASGYQEDSSYDDTDKIREFFIPIERQDYRIKRESENIAGEFREELKDKSHGVNRPWFTIKFDELVANKIEIAGGEKSLKNYFISNDYFSFDVEVTDKGIGAYLFKFAFKKAEDNPNYVEKQWFEEDSSLFFPTFAARRRYYRLATDHTQEDHDRFFRTTRFDPQTGEIRWYFSKRSSKEEWVRDIGRQAVALLNRAFQEAGKGSKHKIKIVLDESEEKELGDIRYNVLNLIVSDITSGIFFGLGPNVANPITGEAISATANIWVSNVINRYIAIVRQYIRFHVYPPAWRFSPSSQGVADFLHKKIQKECPQVVGFINKKRSKGIEFHPDNPPLKDKEFVTACAYKISRTKILQVTVHEMLHGKALRHIFSASADKDNYYENFKEIKDIFGKDIKDSFKEDIFFEGIPGYSHPPKTSSVMDYFHLHYPILAVPGKLDIAALRFVYFDKVEKVKFKEGEDPFLEIPAGADRDPDNPQKSILAVIDSKNFSRQDIRSYRVCGGKKIRYKKQNLVIDSGEFNVDDPLCAKRDYGATPLEIVKNIISDSNNFLMAGRNRYDSESLEEDIALDYGKEYFTQIRNIYFRWHDYHYRALLLKSGKAPADYLFTNEKHVTDYKTLIKDEAKKNPEFKEYYDIRRFLFDYVKKLAFVPVKHCVYKRSDGSYKAVALENIYEKINKSPENSRKVFMNCKSPVVTTWAKDNKAWDKNNQFGTLITEVGFFGHSRKYFLIHKDEDPIDEASIFSIIFSANYSLTKLERKGSFWFFMAQKLASLFSYEPDFANEYYKEMSNYIFYGLDLNGSQKHPYIDEENPHYVHYDADGEIVKLDLPRDGEGTPNLSRVLSYNIDTRITSRFDQAGIYEGRQWSIDEIVLYLAGLAENDDVKKGLSYFNTATEKSIDITQYAEDIKKNPEEYKDSHPFFTEVYKEYKKTKAYKAYEAYREYKEKVERGEIEEIEEVKKVAEPSFAQFIKGHPSVLYLSESGDNLVFPQTKDNFKAQIFQKFNEYSECIKNHETVFCEDIEEKRAFKKAVSDVYYAPRQ